MPSDDLDPPPRPPPLKLETLSLAELEAHIAALEAEIARARQIIQEKQGVRTSADALFRR